MSAYNLLFYTLSFFNIPSALFFSSFSSLSYFLLLSSRGKPVLQAEPFPHCFWISSGLVFFFFSPLSLSALPPHTHTHTPPLLTQSLLLRTPNQLFSLSILLTTTLHVPLSPLTTPFATDSAKSHPAAQHPPSDARGQGAEEIGQRFDLRISRGDDGMADGRIAVGVLFRELGRPAPNLAERAHLTRMHIARRKREHWLYRRLYTIICLHF